MEGRDYMKDRSLVLKDVKFWLTESGLDAVTADKLLLKYKDPLNNWMHEYLVTGSHLTPEDFADEIQQAEEMQQLVCK